MENQNTQMSEEEYRIHLKNQALLEKISSLENQVADLRVNLTISEHIRTRLEEELKSVKGENVQEEK